MQPHIPAPPSDGVLLRDALVSFVALLLAVAACDDITTGNAPRFTIEYIALVTCAVWFGFLGVRLIRLGRPTLGIVSLITLLGALWAQRGIGPAIRTGLWPEYVVMVGVFLWFLALSAVLAVLGCRQRPWTSAQQGEKPGGPVARGSIPPSA